MLMSTNGKTPNKSKTPMRSTAYAADRFIPSRDDVANAIQLHSVATMHGLNNHHSKNDENILPSASRLLLEDFNSSSCTNMNVCSPAASSTSASAASDFSASLAASLFQGEELNSKILAYKTKAPKPSEAFSMCMRSVYAHNKESNVAMKKSQRTLTALPEKVLDAPEMVDDYYLNLLDWSSKDVVAIGLNRSVYLWNAASGAIDLLFETKQPTDTITSVSFSNEGSHLAVGLSNADVLLFDSVAAKQLRNMRGHSARVSSLAWNGQMLSSGSHSSAIFNHDVRQQQHHRSTLQFHTGEVCGLKWSPDGKQLASGSNDNVCAIWDVTSCSSSSSTVAAQPVYTFNESHGAIRALAWCPWQRHLLATGAGKDDRHIRFYNSATGTLVNSVDTHSQVCSLLWSKDRKELVSSHGFVQNQLTVWKYPTMTKVGELTGHSARVLHTAMSPDGTMVASAAADETLRFWKVFPNNQTTGTSSSTGAIKGGIIGKSSALAATTKLGIAHIR